MGNKSFYDPDYIIGINEQRLEQYSILHQKSVEKFTTLLVIYSTFCIFLVPVIQTLFFSGNQYHWFYYCSFCSFCIFFIISVVFSIMLLSPEKLYILVAPHIYHTSIKQSFEVIGTPPDQADIMIKSYYVLELENAITETRWSIDRKTSFYNQAFHFAIIACIPYLCCIWLQINSEKKSLIKKETINILSSFTKTNQLCGGRNQNKKKSMRSWSDI